MTTKHTQLPHDWNKDLPVITHETAAAAQHSSLPFTYAEYERLSVRRIQLESELERVKAERDELLAALHAIISSSYRHTDKVSFVSNAAIAEARAITQKYGMAMDNVSDGIPKIAKEEGKR